MIYIIIIIYIPLSLIVSIKIDRYYKERKRKRLMKSMYEFWNSKTN